MAFSWGEPELDLPEGVPYLLSWIFSTWCAREHICKSETRHSECRLKVQGWKCDLIQFALGIVITQYQPLLSEIFIQFGCFIPERRGHMFFFVFFLLFQNGLSFFLVLWICDPHRLMGIYGRVCILNKSRSLKGGSLICGTNLKIKMTESYHSRRTRN